MSRRAPRLLRLLPVLACLAGCAAKAPLTTLETLRLEVAADANWLSGTQLDLVFVFEPEADAALPATANAWFAVRQALRAGQPTMLVVPLQLPAAYGGADIALPAGYQKALGIYSYASYLAPAGQPRCRLTALVHVVLRLQYDHIDCVGRAAGAPLPRMTP